MLYLDSALELDGVTVFRDYNSPNKFYYMPSSPRLSMENGAPMFQLLIYRRDITDNPDFRAGDRPGGGFLTMTVDLGVPRATIERVKAELASRVSGDLDLVPVPFERGTVRVSALGASSSAGAAGEGGEEGAAAAERGPRFVERILGYGKPSLYDDNRAVFTIELSHEGALLMRSSLEDGGATQVAVVYDLEYSGLMPAYEASIKIDFRQTYNYLRNRFQANTLWFKADIDAEVEQLQKDGHIEIREAEYLDADPARRAERATRLTALAKELATWSFFRPGLTPGRVLADDRGNLTISDPTADAQQNQAGFTAPLVAAGTGRGSPGDVAGPRSQGDSANPATTRVGGEEVPAASASTQPAASTQTGAGSPNAVEAWNRMGRPQAAYLMRSLRQEELQTITFDLRQISPAKRTAAPQGSIRLLPGAAALPGRIKFVDLNDPFFEKIAGTVGTKANLTEAGVSSMIVKVKYGVRDDGTEPKDSKEFTITGPDSTGSYEFLMDRRRSVRIKYGVVVNYKAGYAIGSNVTRAELRDIESETWSPEIDPRLVGAAFPVSLVLGNIDWDKLQSIQSTVSYDDQPSNTHGERTVVFSRNHTSDVVPILPPAGGTRKFKVRTTFFRDGAEEFVDYQGEGTSTVVINPPPGRAIPVSITAADPLARFRTVKVELAYAVAGQAEQTKLVELSGDGAAGSWTFFRPHDTADAKYRYRVTFFGKDGSTRTSEWQTTPERQLIVGDRFESILQVEVRFLVENFTTLGYMGAKLRLEYPEAPPQVKGSMEKFFTGTPEAFIWKVPRSAEGSSQYKYSVQWVRSNASVTQVGPVPNNEELLMIFPPAGA